MNTPKALHLYALSTLPEIQPGDDLARLIAEAIRREGVIVQENSVLIAAQKIISKAEGAVVDLCTITPSKRALSFAKTHNKDPRFIELVLSQSKQLFRVERGIIIAKTHHGFVCANAGIDRSNVPGKEQATLLPQNPDRSAARLREGLRGLLDINISVVISDSFGRPWRRGQVNVALGVAGFRAIENVPGKYDRAGQPLVATQPATADAIAAGAGLLMDKQAGHPVVFLAGLHLDWTEGTAQELLRDSEQDLFR